MGVSCFNEVGVVSRWGWGFIFKREGAPWGALVLVGVGAVRKKSKDGGPPSPTTGNSDTGR